MTPIERLAHLVSTGPTTQPDVVNAELREIWPQIHGPHRNHGPAVLVSLFRYAGYVSNVGPKTATAMTIYRGAVADAAQQGMAWTTDRQIAVTYAQRYSTVAETTVLQATAQPIAILALYEQESEVVVDPDILINVRILTRIPWFSSPFMTLPLFRMRPVVPFHRYRHPHQTRRRRPGPSPERPKAARLLGRPRPCGCCRARADAGQPCRRSTAP
jgi:hypothetical protein